MSRIKRIVRAQFVKVQDQNWTPMQLMEDDVREFAPRIAGDERFVFIASGQYQYGNEIAYSSGRIRGNLVGGIDCIRRYPGAPVPFKRDWLAVVDSSTDKEHLLLDGPHKEEGNHHLKGLPPYGCKITFI
jgi:hypothetical protein